MLNNYLMNRLNVATGHFSCSRGLSHSQMPQFTQTPSQPVPSINVQQYKGHDSAFMPPEWDRRGHWPMVGPAPTIGPIYSFWGWWWLHVWRQYQSLLLWSPCPLLRVYRHGCRPKHSTVHQFKIRKYLSGLDSLYKHQMVMIKIKLN